MKPPSIRTLLVLVYLAGVVPMPVAAQQPAAGGAPLPDGTPLQGDQFPRFLRPTHTGMFGFDNFLVLGDYPTVRFKRGDIDQETGVTEETWARVGVTEVAGRAVSVFRPEWPADVLRQRFRSQRWGVDRPMLFWGEVVVPGAGDSGRRAVYLQMAPTNLSASQVVRVNDSVQYASHAVNIWVPDFGESRVQRGDAGIDLAGVTRPFYELFVDEYETLAVVSQTALLTDELGFHQNVQNSISGIGLPVFDDSATYRSDGTLQGIEVYPPGGWATARATLHQQSHQWGDYSAVWDRLGIVRQGDDPDYHTPLITPGAVLAGAVLEGTRHVAAATAGGFVIERTIPTIRYHPITLYRMGLVPANDLPEIRLFLDQGQFDPSGRSAPDVGSRVDGGEVVLVSSDLLAADGGRTGPVVDRVRRALIYVTRDGLASAEEMDIINFYGARFGATRGVTSWDGYPSFFEATHGRASMSTDITPRRGATVEGKIESHPPVEDLPVAADALTGVLLDGEIPGRVARGEALTLTGRVTATDRDDFTIVCFRFLRYGASDPNDVFVCSSLAVDRFVVEHTFTSRQSGVYTVEPFLFWPDSEGQLARARYGVVVVE